MRIGPPSFRRTLAGVPSHWLGFARPSRCRLCRSWQRSPDGSTQLLDADQVARGIAEGAVANPVRLLGRLLDDLGAAGLQPREGAVEVGGGAGVGGGGMKDDGRAGLVGGSDRDPAHPAVSDVVVYLEAENVAVEGQGGVRVVVREEARVNGDVHGSHSPCVNGDVHGGHSTCGSGAYASR